MIISRVEFQLIMNAALIGSDSFYNQQNTDEAKEVIQKVEKYIDEVDKINGVKAERISIDVCAN